MSDSPSLINCVNSIEKISQKYPDDNEIKQLLINIDKIVKSYEIISNHQMRQIYHNVQSLEYQGIVSKVDNIKSCEHAVSQWLEILHKKTDISYHDHSILRAFLTIVSINRNLDRISSTFVSPTQAESYGMNVTYLLPPSETVQTSVNVWKLWFWPF